MFLSTLHDNTMNLQVGEMQINEDCTEKYECLANQSVITLATEPPCDRNAMCIWEPQQNRTCQCEVGYIASGDECITEGKDD